MKNKLYVLNIEERNGEQEYNNRIYVIAPNENEMKEWARDYVQDFYGNSQVYDKRESNDPLNWEYETSSGGLYLMWKVDGWQTVEYLPEMLHFTDKNIPFCRIKLTMEER